jgi:hypothetical protein
MTSEKFELLQDELVGLHSAANHLNYSMERCHDLIGRKNWSMEELERLESLTSRFARLSDLLIQRILRMVDEIELSGGGTVLDRIFRAEKRGWVNAAQLIRIRELRNLIAHEYADEKMAEIYTAVTQFAPALLLVIPRIAAYANELAQRYPTAK